MIDWQAYDIDLGRGAGRTSGYVKTYCPECHKNGKPKSDHSLSCNVETGAFKCHRCGYQGYATITTPEEKEAWMRQQPWYKSYTAKKTEEKKDYAKPPKPRSTKIDPGIVKYFAGRGISEETLVKMKVTSGTDWMPAHKGHRLPDGANCTTIHFNYYKNGELVATKLRSGDKMFRQAKAGCEQIAYGLDNIKDKSDVYIVEGEMDALSLVEIGYTQVISVPDGGSDRTMHWLVDYYEEYFADKQTVYICSDNDTVGSDLCRELQKHFDIANTVIITDYGQKPDGTFCKDANDCLMYCGPDVLRKKLSEGKTVQPEGDVDPQSLADEMDDIYENGLPPGLPVGIPGLDDIFRFQKGRLFIFTGTPGSGKSQLLDHIAVLMNINYGWKFSMFSPEMKPLGQHGIIIAQKYIGKHIDKYSVDRDTFNKARDRVKETFHLIDPDDYELDTILAIAKYQVRKYGCECIILDPWNDLMNKGNGITNTDDVNTALIKILTFAQRQDIAAVVMAHPKKRERKKDGTYAEIDLNDISGSAHFENRADLGIIVSRIKANDPNNTTGVEYTKVVNGKTRFETLGKLGETYLRYQVGVGRFHPFDPTTGETKWDERNYLDKHAVQGIIPMDERTAAPASEANVQGFLDQAARADREQHRPTSLDSDDDLPFDNNENEPPF